MTNSCSEKLRNRAAALASSLDRLILEQAAPFLDAVKGEAETVGKAPGEVNETLFSTALVGTDVLILEDESFALTLTCLAGLCQQNQRNSVLDSRVFVRLRSYQAAQRLEAILLDYPQEVRDKVLIAGLCKKGEIDSETLALAEFLKKHRYRGTVAIGRLPKSHTALREWAKSFAGQQKDAAASGVMILGGVIKHMTHRFNDTLGEYFQNVKGLRGRGKHRCLFAAIPQTSFGQETSQSEHDVILPLRSYGGVFSGSRSDRGGELLAAAALRELRKITTPGMQMLDLGCGNGSVSLRLLRESNPQQIAAILATDIDADAVISATMNLVHDNRVTVTWDDAGGRIHPNTIDLVLLNPPFHEGTKIDMTLVRPLLDAAHRVLRAGGVLLLVHNSHARYRGAVEKRFKNVTQVERDAVFTVLRAVR